MYLNQRINHKIKLLKYISEVLLMIIKLLSVLHIIPYPDYTNEATCSTYHSPMVPWSPHTVTIWHQWHTHTGPRWVRGQTSSSGHNSSTATLSSWSSVYVVAGDQEMFQISRLKWIEIKINFMKSLKHFVLCLVFKWDHKLKASCRKEAL